MKAATIQLNHGDAKAIIWIQKNLQVCAHNRTLSRLLLKAFPAENYQITAIIPEWVHLEQLNRYDQGSVPPDNPPDVPGDSPLDVLVERVVRYLQEAPGHIAVCENSGDARKTLEIWTWSRPPRFFNYGDEETYYILSSGKADAEMIDAALADSLGHWGICVCAPCACVPEGDISNESFLVEISKSANHILMSAFDGDGYLIYSLMDTGTK